MRRRLKWGGIFAAVAGVVAALVVLLPGTKKGEKETFSSAPAQLAPKPKTQSFMPRAEEVLDIARKFVVTAVARRHVEDSWDLAAPSLRHGYTRGTWAKGNIPVVPYPVYSGRWRLAYSFQNEVSIEVALFPRPRSKVRPVVFDLKLRRVPLQGHSRWLVSSFLPAPSESGDQGGGARSLVLPRTGDSGTTRLGLTWLLVPAGVFGLVLLVLAVLGVRSWRTRALYRAYVRARQTSSSSPS